MTGRFRRLAETDRPQVTIYVDDAPVQALAGDTVLVAMLTSVRHLRSSEFGDGRRAGLCLMGACQDCWVWTGEGARLRACTTRIAEGLRVSTKPPEMTWASLASS